MGGTPENTVTHLYLDAVTQGWTQRRRQWFLGAWLLEKFCQCPVETDVEETWSSCLSLGQVLTLPKVGHSHHGLALFCF